MSSYHSIRPRFPDGGAEGPGRRWGGFVPAPWARNRASALHEGANAHEGANTSDAAPKASSKAEPASGTAAPPPVTGPNQGPSGSPSGGPTQGSGEGPDVIEEGRSYRQGPVYGSPVPTETLQALGVTTHMGTLRLETAALGRMTYLQAVADQHHQLQTVQQRVQPGTPPDATQPTLFAGDGAPTYGDGLASSDITVGNPSLESPSAPPTSAYQYDNIYSGRAHVVERMPGTFVKSMQGIAEDLYRRIYKRLPPAQDPLADPGFRRLYDRVRRGLQRLSGTASSQKTNAHQTDAPETDAASCATGTHAGAPWIENIGPAVPSTNKLIRDRNGRRWRLRREDAPLGILPSGDGAPRDNSTEVNAPSTPAQTRLAVRSSGPAPRIRWHRRQLDPLRIAERLYAYRESLHTAFSTAWKARMQPTPSGEWGWTRHRPKDGRRSETALAQRGSRYPSFVSVGRWRLEEIDRKDPDSAITVPWIIADIDGPDVATSTRYAKQLCHLLSKHGLDAEHIVVSYTGGQGLHIRIPQGAVGSPIYQSAEAAHTLLTGFFDRLCKGHPKLRDAIDDTACHPRQMIRMIGSQRETGRQCIAMSGKELKDTHPLVLLGHSDNARYDGYTLPKPEETSHTPALEYLLLREQHDTTTHPVHHRVQQLLQDLIAPQVTITLNTSSPNAPPQGSHQTVINYCWKPYYSRPPPESPDGVIGRLLQPVAEAEAWGEAVEAPYVGRNAASFVMGLYATSYPEVALRRVLGLVQGRNGEPQASGRWTRRLHEATRADGPAVRTVLQAWNELICRPALPEREVDATLRSARSYTTRK